MINDQKNMILAIGLSVLVIIGWQYFIGGPQLDKQRQEAQLKQKQAQQAQQPGACCSLAPAGPGAAVQQVRRPQVPGAAFVPGQIADPRGRGRRLAARRDRHADREGLGIAARRPPRRSRADQISRDRRSEIAADRAARAVRLAASLLRRVRLGAGRGQHASKVPTRTRSGPRAAAARSASTARSRSSSTMARASNSAA